MCVCVCVNLNSMVFLAAGNPKTKIYHILGLRS